MDFIIQYHQVIYTKFCKFKFLNIIYLFVLIFTFELFSLILSVMSLFVFLHNSSEKFFQCDSEVFFFIEFFCLLESIQQLSLGDLGTLNSKMTIILLNQLLFLRSCKNKRFFFDIQTKNLFNKSYIRKKWQ